MSQEWNQESNCITDEEIDVEAIRLENQRMAAISDIIAQRDERIRRDYIIPEGMPEEEVRELFQNISNHYVNNQYSVSHGVFLCYGPNQLWYVCHNCGCIGKKWNKSSKLFKCYMCRSRNVDLIRASYLSKLLRENPENTTNMEDVYNEHREELRLRRTQRSTR